LAEIVLRNKAIGTSGTGTQYFYHQGKRYGHIIDPRNGQPSDSVLSTTVVARRATMADALSTAFHVMGVERVTEYCANHSDVAALITRPGKRAGHVELLAIGLGDDEWQPVGE
jgi:thiamine biosynthesis lipoprotein